MAPLGIGSGVAGSRQRFDIHRGEVERIPRFRMQDVDMLARLGDMNEVVPNEGAPNEGAPNEGVARAGTCFCWIGVQQKQIPHTQPG